MSNLFSDWSPRKLWSPTLIFFVSILILKLLVFDLIWCSASSFASLANPLVYIHVILLTFILSAPLGLFHRKWVQVGVLFVVDLWLISTLHGNGNYLAAITPLDHLLLGALPETRTNPDESLAWSYLFFALTTLAAAAIALRYKGRTPVPVWGKLQYLGYLLAWSLLAWLVN